jgi:hypothetical protein
MRTQRLRTAHERPVCFHRPEWSDAATMAVRFAERRLPDPANVLPTRPASMLTEGEPSQPQTREIDAGARVVAFGVVD